MVSDTPLMISDKPSNVYGKRLRQTFKRSLQNLKLHNPMVMDLAQNHQ
jgi:hypothetical protein